MQREYQRTRFWRDCGQSVSQFVSHSTHSVRKASCYLFTTTRAILRTLSLPVPSLNPIILESGEGNFVCAVGLIIDARGFLLGLCVLSASDSCRFLPRLLISGTSF